MNPGFYGIFHSKKKWIRRTNEQTLAKERKKERAKERAKGPIKKQSPGKNKEQTHKNEEK